MSSHLHCNPSRARVYFPKTLVDFSLHLELFPRAAGLALLLASPLSLYLPELARATTERAPVGVLYRYSAASARDRNCRPIEFPDAAKVKFMRGRLLRCVQCRLYVYTGYFWLRYADIVKKIRRTCFFPSSSVGNAYIS